MACAISSGRTTPCKDALGGLDKIYFLNDTDTFVSGDITYNANGEGITSITGTHSAYKYDLKGDQNSFTQNIVSSRDNGTTYFEQVLQVTLPNLALQDNKELKLLAYGNPKVIIKDNNNKFWLMGLEFGADVTGGSSVTGAAMGDLSGYTLTLTAKEPVMANLFDDVTEAALATACGLTIV